jgi:hypothetical protein
MEGPEILCSGHCHDKTVNLTIPISATALVAPGSDPQSQQQVLYVGSQAL